MSFPLLDGKRPYVLIVRGDRFPCGSPPWVQLAIGFANHGQKARTLAYNPTIDVALTSEHDIDALRAIFSKTLEALQSIMNAGWILIREKWCRARVMLGGDSPRLVEVPGISSYFRIRSIYTYATWCEVKGKWEDRKWRRSPKRDKKLYKLHKKGKGKGKVLRRSPNSSVSVIPTCPKAQQATSYYTHQNSCNSGTVNSRET